LAHAVYADDYAGGESGALDCGSDGAAAQVHFPVGDDARPVALDKGNFPQQITIRDWRIGLWHGIAASRDLDIVAPLCGGMFGDNAMNGEAVVAGAQHNVAFGYRPGLGTLDHQRVAGADRGQHAPAGDAEAQSTGHAQRLRRQIALEGMSFAGICGVRVCCETAHDTRGEILQLSDVPLILPHVSALVTKTFS
jgi:hypothetical protein